MTAQDGMVALAATGEVVPTSSPAWLAECKARHDHAQTLLRMRGVHMRHARQQYLAQVERAEGAESARRLRLQLEKLWNAGEPGADAGGGS